MTDAPQLVPLKYVTSHNDETLPETTNPETPIKYIEISDVQSQIGIVNSTSLTFGDAPSRARRIIRTGDVLVSTVRTYLRAIASAGEAQDGYIASTGFCVLRANKILPPYLKYAASSPDFVEAVVANSTGVSYPAINASDLVRLPIPVPDQSTQHRITAFLDHETAHIDAMIAKQERLIELLAEKRQAIITQAVTKGLDSSVPTKPSGTPWLGDIRAHWSHCQLKQASIMVTDGAHVSPETENGQYDFVSTKDMGTSGIDFEGSLKTSAESYRSLVLAGCQPQAGDLLFSKDGTIGRTTVINESREFVVASSLIIIRPNSKLVFNKYLDFVCQSRPVQSQVSSYTKGAGLPRLSIASLRRVRIPLPPLDEQMDIAENLTARTSTIDYMCQRTRVAIGLLKERRSALISAAVTGKIDVREGAA